MYMMVFNDYCYGHVCKVAAVAARYTFNNSGFVWWCTAEGEQRPTMGMGEYLGTNE